MEAVNILCFGDSLTEGYSRWGSIFTPYAEDMKTWLDAALPSTKLTVEVNGMSGDRVVSGLFLSRITAECKRTKTPYDWVIVLGGTNDLGYGLDGDSVFAGLEKIYEVAFGHGANILALTVPECQAASKGLDARRYRLNSKIKEYKAGRFFTLDLHALMPYHSMSEESREKIWDDGLHFTPYGYSVMGDHIANRLTDILGTMAKEDEMVVQSGKVVE